MLRQIRVFFQQQRTASLAELAGRFGVTADAMRGMLEHWVRKGRLRRLPASRVCPQCAGCEAAALEIYEWTD